MWKEEEKNFKRSHTKDYTESFTFFYPETGFGKLGR